MKKKRKNRLASLLSDFAKQFEIPYTLDSDSQGANLAVSYGGKRISAGYSFDRSEASYEYGAVVGQVQASERDKFASRIMTSDPIRGITERIALDGKIIVYGSRGSLERLSDRDIQRGFMDDVARVTAAYDKFSELSDELEDED